MSCKKFMMNDPVYHSLSTDTSYQAMEFYLSYANKGLEKYLLISKNISWINHGIDNQSHCSVD